jgi:hypothetical protein
VTCTTTCPGSAFGIGFVISFNEPSGSFSLKLSIATARIILSNSAGNKAMQWQLHYSFNFDPETDFLWSPEDKENKSVVGMAENFPTA